MRKKYLHLFVLCIIYLFPAPFLSAQKTVSGFEAPESVIKFENKLFVSNIGGGQPNPMALDSNGFISELSIEGKMISRKFSKALLNAPKGLAIAKNGVYVADINRIVGFDTRSGEKIFELAIEGTSMLNDLCTIDDETLAVSETVQGKVYLVHLGSKTVDYIGSIDGANGVTYDAATKQLYACGVGMQMDGRGKLFVKDLSSKDTVFTTLQNSPLGIFDGLEMTDDSHLIVTDWVSFAAGNKAARFVIYDIKAHSYIAYDAPMSPADLCYDKASHKIFLPMMMKNSLWMSDIGTLKKLP